MARRRTARSSLGSSIDPALNEGSPRLSRLTRAGWLVWGPALLLGVATLLVVGTIAFAAASIRCCADGTGTTATGWIVIGLLVLAAALGAGAVGAGIGWSIRRLARMISHRRQE